MSPWYDEQGVGVTPHPRRAIILAWLDGASIEYWTTRWEWKSIEHPTFDPKTDYRTAPKEKLRIALMYVEEDGSWYSSTVANSDTEYKAKLQTDKRFVKWVTDWFDPPIIQ